MVLILTIHSYFILYDWTSSSSVYSFTLNVTISTFQRRFFGKVISAAQWIICPAHRGSQKKTKCFSVDQIQVSKALVEEVCKRPRKQSTVRKDNKLLLSQLHTWLRRYTRGWEALQRQRYTSHRCGVQWLGRGELGLSFLIERSTNSDPIWLLFTQSTSFKMLQTQKTKTSVCRSLRIRSQCN